MFVMRGFRGEGRASETGELNFQRRIAERLCDAG
jgi:hypothetical protein